MESKLPIAEINRAIADLLSNIETIDYTNKMVEFYYEMFSTEREGKKYYPEYNAPVIQDFPIIKITTP